MGNKSVTQMLLETGSSVNARDAAGRTALHVAARTDDMSGIVQALLQRKASISAHDDEGLSPLHVAAAQGSLQTARLLLSARAGVNSPSSSGDTPLHVAARRDELGLVKMLLESKATLTQLNTDGQSPLDVASALSRKRLSLVARIPPPPQPPRCTTPLLAPTPPITPPVTPPLTPDHKHQPALPLTMSSAPSKTIFTFNCVQPKTSKDTNLIGQGSPAARNMASKGKRTTRDSGSLPSKRKRRRISKGSSLVQAGRTGEIIVVSRTEPRIGRGAGREAGTGSISSGSRKFPDEKVSQTTNAIDNKTRITGYNDLGSTGALREAVKTREINTQTARELAESAVVPETGRGAQRGEHAVDQQEARVITRH
jgi:ankyrin repeat protein